MLTERRPFFDYSRHQLQVRNLDAALDVLAFTGKEALSRPFAYQVEFTATQRDLPADRLLGQAAHFSLHPPPIPLPFAGLSLPPAKPLRSLHGVVTPLESQRAQLDNLGFGSLHALLQNKE
ncbi:hypothetical protein D9M68_598160 [compost metagenome]